ncbi:MAG TPA: YdjY domain-containing protein [Thermoanaerobaculia bacterium]|nr:YdjY domain-containing protein [Thermoanaerobaculia bacterium]
MRRAVLFAVALALVGCAPGGAEEAPGRVAVDRAARAVSFPATVHAGAFHRRVLGMPGYHLVVWRGGSAAPAALFRAAVTDVQVLEALESLGAKPGNALGMKTWDEREDPRSPAPERVIAGPPVEVLVRVPGRKKPLGLAEILEDPGRRGFAMRFGGHRANVPQWHSGCVVCLYSCPGSKVGNAAYTVRDWVEGTTSFRVRRGVLPPDGTGVTITLRLLRRS